MDAGKHAPWGELYPDLKQYVYLDYTFPPNLYRPDRYVEKPRFSPYPIYELAAARKVLLKSVLDHNPKQVKSARFKSLLGIPAEIDDVVWQHVDSGVPYDKLEPNQAKYQDIVKNAAETSKVSELNVCDQVITDKDGTGSSNCEIREGNIDTLPSTSKNDDVDSGIDPMEDSPESLKTRLTELNLVCVIKCDYCPFVYKVDCDVTDSMTQKMSQHLQEEKHYCASRYFAKEISEGDYELTELHTSMIVKNEDAYLHTVLPMCPQCGLVMQTVHQVAVHYRYSHEAGKGKYALVPVIETCTVTFEGITSKTCSICKEVFNTLKGLRAHLKEAGHALHLIEHDGDKKLKHLIPCPASDVCNKVYNGVVLLRGHFEMAHAHIKPVPDVEVRTYHGLPYWEKNSDKFLTFTIPKPSSDQIVMHKSTEMIQRYDQKMMRKNVMFFRDVVSYPAKPCEKLYLSNFRDDDLRGEIIHEGNAEKRMSKLCVLRDTAKENGDTEAYDRIEKKLIKAEKNDKRKLRRRRMREKKEKNEASRNKESRRSDDVANAGSTKRKSVYDNDQAGDRKVRRYDSYDHGERKYDYDTRNEEQTYSRKGDQVSAGGRNRQTKIRRERRRRQRANDNPFGGSNVESFVNRVVSRR